MKIHAYQRPPEYQESPLFWDESSFEGVELYGNTRLNERTSDQFRNIPGMLDDLAEDLYYMMQGVKHVCRDWGRVLATVTGRDSYTRAERKEWVRILKRWTETDEETTIFLDVLRLLNGKEYAHSTLWGCCQGDWQNIIYPAKYGAEWLRAFETEYFNLGTEWSIQETDDPDDPGFTMYCTTDDPRAEIADATGADPDDVILYAFDGWDRTPKYKVVGA